MDFFVSRDEIDDLYFNNPYYIIPDGEAAGVCGHPRLSRVPALPNADRGVHRIAIASVSADGAYDDGVYSNDAHNDDGAYNSDGARSAADGAGNGAGNTCTVGSIYRGGNNNSRGNNMARGNHNNMARDNNKDHRRRKRWLRLQDRL